MANILVLDDDEQMTVLYRRILEMHGHLVRTATNSGQFMEYIQGGKFDLFITDLRMPDMHGLICVEKALETQPGIGIVIMTGAVNLEGWEREVLRNSPFRMLFKPFEPKDLEEAVSTSLTKFKSNK